MFGFVPLHMPPARLYPSMISRCTYASWILSSVRNLTNFIVVYTFTLGMSLRDVYWKIEFSLCSSLLTGKNKVSQLNLLNSIVLEIWNIQVKAHVFSPNNRRSAMKQTLIKIYKSNIKSSQYHYASIRSNRIKFSTLQLSFYFLPYIDSINIFRSNYNGTEAHTWGKHMRQGKAKTIKCNSCFTFTTSEKVHCGWQEHDAKRVEWEMKMEQHQFVATSDLLQDLQINRKTKQEGAKIISLVAITIEFWT